MKTGRTVGTALAALWAAGAAARAAAPDAPSQYFNAAGAEYADARDAVASNLLVEALARFPDDPELRALKALLERPPPPPEQQPQPPEQQPQPPEQQPQQGNGEEPPPQDQPQDGRQEPPQGDAARQQEAGEDGRSGQPREAQRMTPDEARMLLDAMREEEAANREQLRLHLGQPVPVEKDW